MTNTDYVEQNLTEPAFAELLWSKPETKQSAGKLLIVGGNANGISAPMNSYAYAQEAQIGAIRVVLPKSLRPIAGKLIEQGDYLPNTPSGSFGKQGLAELLDLSEWADAVMLAGDFGRNSETAILIESFINKATRPVVVTKDGFDYIASTPNIMSSAPGLTSVISLSQLQKYVKTAKKQPPITFDMTQPQLARAVKELSIGNMTIITKHHDAVFTAHEGTASITKGVEENELWQIKTASYAAVWLAQQPEKPFESITTAVYDAHQPKDVGEN